MDLKTRTAQLKSLKSHSDSDRVVVNMQRNEEIIICSLRFYYQSQCVHSLLGYINIKFQVPLFAFYSFLPIYKFADKYSRDFIVMVIKNGLLYFSTSRLPNLLKYDLNNYYTSFLLEQT